MKSFGAKQIAERYVKALLAVSGKSQSDVEKDLRSLQSTLAGSRDLASFLSSPLYTRAQMAEAMDAILSAVKAHKITRQFVGLLARKKRLELLPEIIAIYLEEAARNRGEMKAELISAAPLSDKEIAKIGDTLSKTYGKKIIIEARQDKELLGGVVIRIGSAQLDASIAGKLKRLTHTLKKAA